MSGAGGSVGQSKTVMSAPVAAHVARRAAAPAAPAPLQEIRLPAPAARLLEVLADELHLAEVRRLDNAEELKRLALRAGVAPLPRPCAFERPDLDAALRRQRCLCVGSLAELVRGLSGLLDREAQTQWWVAELLGQLGRAQRRAEENKRLRKELAKLRTQLRRQRAEEEEEEEEEDIKAEDRHILDMTDFERAHDIARYGFYGRPQ